MFIKMAKEKIAEKIKDKGITERKSKMDEDLRIVRILSTDIFGNKKILPGLTKIKGISWSMSNAVCKTLKINKDKKIGSLTKEDIQKILDFIKNPSIPEFLLNRRKDRDTGKNMHLVTSDLELKTEFDIKRYKKIKTYRGLRHMLGQPVRGQRTRSHFRKNKSVGVMKKGKKGRK